MDTKFDDGQGNGPRIHAVTLARGIAWGLLGGLAGTVVMDLLLMGALSIAGLPALTCFSLVGNTVARFFIELGIATAGGVPAGVAAHYVVGPLFGVLYGAVVLRIAAFNVNTTRKAVLYAILYAELLSQPILVMTPILLNMTAAATLQWYGGSFVMHLLWGLVAGIVVGRGLKLQPHTPRILSR